MDNEISVRDEDLSLLQNLQREHTITEVLNLLLYNKTPEGKKYTLEEACEVAGISKGTWYNWASDGSLTSPLRNLKAQMDQMAYDILIPRWGEMLDRMVTLAMGDIPEHSKIRAVKASDAIRAFKELSSKIVPVQPIDGSMVGQQSELEHIQQFQPQQFIVEGNMQFIYQGGEKGKQFGNLDSISGQVEGDYEEVDENK